MQFHGLSLAFMHPEILRNIGGKLELLLTLIQMMGANVRDNSLESILSDTVINFFENVFGFLQKMAVVKYAFYYFMRDFLIFSLLQEDWAYTA